MSTNAPVSTRTEFTIVDGPSRKRLTTLQVVVDMERDKSESSSASVVFELRDWNGGGEKKFAVGDKIRRSAIIIDIDWSMFKSDGYVTIKGVMARGIKMRCNYDPQAREGELITENSDMY